MLTHTSLIDRYDTPHYFRDIMIKGHFRSFEHEHFFESTVGGGTLMRDRLHFAAPFPPLGWFAERLILRRYLTRFLQERNAAIKRIAESAPGDWQHYLDHRNLTPAL
jgi:ligand-binding SRPBCC domain-containing protein